MREVLVGYEPIIVAIVALIIATVVYRWQKGEDRKLQIQLQKLNAYANFFAEATQVLNLLTMAVYQSGKAEEALEKVDTVMHQLRSSLNIVLFYSTSKEVIVSCGALERSLWAYRGHLRAFRLDKRVYHKFSHIADHSEAGKIARSDFAECIVLAKSDISGKTNGEIRNLLDNVLVALKDEGSEE